MTPRTYRRKLQKKLKRKPFIRCFGCGARMAGRLDGEGGRWWLVYSCERRGCGCGRVKDWTGGGKADTYPTAPPAGERRQGRAGSNPAPSA